MFPAIGLTALIAYAVAGGVTPANANDKNFSNQLPVPSPTSSSLDSVNDVSSALTVGVPNGYKLVWRKEFVQIVLDKEPSPWASYFLRYNVRALAGNADEGIKVSDEFMTRGTGRSAGAALRADGRWDIRTRYLHEASDGTLKLRAFPLATEMRYEFWGYPYVASMISAERAPGQVYGYWETRVRFNRIGKGQHLAIWLLPDDGSWPPEVDLLEVIGNDPHQFYANLHLSDGAGPPINSYPEPASATGFHTIGFLWTPTKMKWTIDGRVIRQQANVLNTKPMHILVSWEIGSKWPGDPDNTTLWPAEVELDYVRVYKGRA